MIDNNYFPCTEIVETIESKQEALLKLEREIEIDKGILELVNVVNGIPLLLSSSSCEGQNGNKSSHHWKYTYIGIGVLYNQIKFIEDLALRLKQVLKDEVKCVLQFDSPGFWKEDNNRLPLFRAFLKVEFANQLIMPHVIALIKQFAESMPSMAEIADNYEVTRANELEISSSVEKFISRIASSSDSFDDVDYEERIRSLLQQSTLTNVDVFSSLVIKFDTLMDTLVEDLFRIVTAATEGLITAFYELNLDHNNQFSRKVLIDLKNPDHYHVVESILRSFIESKKGKFEL